jgi:hypothetical protein
MAKTINNISQKIPQQKVRRRTISISQELNKMLELADIIMENGKLNPKSPITISGFFEEAGKHRFTNCDDCIGKVLVKTKEQAQEIVRKCRNVKIQNDIDYHQKTIKKLMGTIDSMTEGNNTKK